MKRFIIGLLLCSVSPAVASEQYSARDLFFEQAEAPQEHLNTGVKYWIELTRNNKRIAADSRTAFKSGDEIRFRIVPNVNGYCYIAMTRGSSGKREMLFPNRELATNRVISGRMYTIPAHGSFKFDNHPGTENIKILVSRRPIDSTAILKDDPTWVTVSGDSDSKPKLANSVIVAFAEGENQKLAMTDDSARDQSAPESHSRDLFFDSGSQVHKSSSGRSPIHHRQATHHRTRVAHAPSPADRPGTIVLTLKPEDALGANIPLKHF